MIFLALKPLLDMGRKLLSGRSTGSTTLQQEKAENTTLIVAAVALTAGVAVTLLIKEVG